MATYTVRLASGKRITREMADQITARNQAEAILSQGANSQERWWKFGGSNLQAAYGWGTRAQADEYARHLNHSRDVNHYYADPLSQYDDEATNQAGCVDIKVEGVNLDDELSEFDPRETD